MVGSGVSRHSSGQNNQTPPTWRGFLEHSLQFCQSETKHIRQAIKRGQYLDGCEWIKRNLGDSWPRYLRESFVQPKFRPAEIHQLIYQLDCRIVLTPNFDRIYDNYALQESEGTIVVKKYSDDDIVEYIRRADRLILKAHGSIDEVGKMIFTRNQYAAARSKHSSFYRLLDSLIITNTVLMIGVGLDDPDFQLLFEDHQARFENALPHYMTFGGSPHRDLVQTMRETTGISLLPYSSARNHKALVSSLKSLIDRVSARRNELTVNMDW